MTIRRPTALTGVAVALLAAAGIFAATRLWRTSVPGDLRLADLDPRAYFSSGELHRTSDYQAFVRIDSLLASVAQLVALGLYAVKGKRFTRESAAGRIGTGMFLGMLGFAFVWFAQFPFGLAAQWWERRHHLSHQGYVTWAINDWLSIGGKFLFVSLALFVVMALAGVLRQRWWLAGGPALAAIGVAFAFLQPYLIPDLHPLHRQNVAADARRLARDEGIPGTPVRVQNVHKLTDAPNAEAAGFGASRRVILWDTLLRRFRRNEIRVVLAHEFAHLARHHIWKSFAWAALLALPIGLVMELVTRRRGGLFEPLAVPLGIFVVVLALFVLSPLNNAFSRRLESEADWVALQTTRDPASAQQLFRRFTTTALAQPRPPGWSELLQDDHPSVIDRIAMARAWRDRHAPAR